MRQSCFAEFLVERNMKRHVKLAAFPMHVTKTIVIFHALEVQQRAVKQVASG